MNLKGIVIVSVTLCVAGVLLPACPRVSNDCAPTATRCDGDLALICNGAAQWTIAQDCTQVAEQSGGSWVCCAVPPDAGSPENGDPGPDHLCVPSNVCAALSDGGAL